MFIGESYVFFIIILFLLRVTEVNYFIKTSAKIIKLLSVLNYSEHFQFFA